MDGYAVRVADVALATSAFPVSQRIPAGASGAPLQAGTVARIFTGAPIPQGADAVVMQEDCIASDALLDGQPCITVNADPQVGQWIRRAGEDVTRGAVVLQRSDVEHLAAHRERYADVPLLCIDPGILETVLQAGFGNYALRRVEPGHDALARAHTEARVRAAVIDLKLTRDAGGQSRALEGLIRACRIHCGHERTYFQRHSASCWHDCGAWPTQCWQIHPRKRTGRR